MEINLEKARNYVKNHQKNFNSRFRLNYHLMAPLGWMNDPNGLICFRGQYHAFYQFHPYSKDWGPMHWGHATSPDMVHWQNQPVALAPGEEFDQGGCYSGSAVDYHGQLALVYTGHVFDDPQNNDPFSPDFRQMQNLALSQDGINFTKFADNPIIPLPPQDNDRNFRDPKVWFQNGEWNLIVGSSANNVGRTLIYRSPDLKHWKYLGVLATSAGELGSMWECPDFFTLDGCAVQTFSPVGIKAQGDKYQNVFQTGALVGKYDYQKNEFNHGAFNELDKGHDFYAVQTFQTADGRRVAIGWMNMWQTPMPEKLDNWAGAFTLPRELRVQNGQVTMQPIEELKSLRQEVLLSKNNFQLESQQELLTLAGNSAEILLRIPLRQQLAAPKIGFKLIDRKQQPILSFVYDRSEGKLVLNRYQADGIRKAAVTDLTELDLQIFVDKSSVEIFVNHGQATFTSRIFPTSDLGLALTGQDQAEIDQLQIYRLAQVIE
ncbi:glycoside hydrolase family 32 protein [Liquorilactobacillus sicerae]|uniref:glycoside hydrolase family 32 protein n=1 Tax=Liquorilactobacillus sicerae TaxID=1416943 RepID=UPI002480CC65|nr:glycoside hydrolase family 32 protein [Liquorilactobacillus sicerae]